MYCKNCGKTLDDVAVICPHCGVAVKEVNPKPEYVNAWAIVAFIFSFFSPLLGWIFGGLGLLKASKNNGEGKDISIAAIIVACVIFFISLCILKDLLQKLSL